uniref:Uncharacterized protein n=1 Tax=Trichobilharzia regenti TaxID=157069 RepID=A0AA85J635_TRIRE|nr:unnamed protein product [Trichobilharzia regenti]
MNTFTVLTTIMNHNFNNLHSDIGSLQPDDSKQAVLQLPTSQAQTKCLRLHKLMSLILFQPLISDYRPKSRCTAHQSAPSSWPLRVEDMKRLVVFDHRCLRSIHIPCEVA